MISMRRFTALCDRLDATCATNGKVAAMIGYLRAAPPGDAAWAVYLLSGQRLKRVVPPQAVRDWGRAASRLPEWLFDECYETVGDLGETIALLVGAARGKGSSTRLETWIEERLLGLREVGAETQRERLIGWWRSEPPAAVFLLVKMLTGSLRVGVSAALVVRAVAEMASLDRVVVTHRLSRQWRPAAAEFERLVAPDEGESDPARPYPFYLASPLEGRPADLGELGAWLAEWKWDGIRGQLVCRAREVFLWSRGEELLTELFPEIVDAAARLPDGTVLDGEVVAWIDGRPLPFSVLQERIGRKRVSGEILTEAPVAFVAFDLLEVDGNDVRSQALSWRRERLGAVLPAGFDPRLVASPVVCAESWGSLENARAMARERGVEGLVLKRRRSVYRVGRRKGDWWKWKVDPYRVDAVLVYAQPGHGRRANLLTDYTFAVWGDDERLVPVAKAYNGLTHDEIGRLDRWIRRHTVERFGPVRAVEPRWVFELHFDGIRESRRHASGLAVRLPRIARWREDKGVEEADSLVRLQELL